MTVCWRQLIFSKKITLINILSVLSMNALTIETMRTPQSEMTLVLGIDALFFMFLISSTSYLVSAIRNMRFTIKR